MKESYVELKGEAIFTKKITCPTKSIPQIESPKGILTPKNA